MRNLDHSELKEISESEKKMLSYNYSLPNGTYSLSVNTKSGYNINYASSITISGSNVIEYVNFTTIPASINVAEYKLAFLLNDKLTYALLPLIKIEVG